MSDDAVIIPFPTRDLGTDDLVADEPDDDGLDGFTMSITCEDCGSIGDDHNVGCPVTVEQDPDVIEADGGRWVWEPLHGQAPSDPVVGLASHRIDTMCKWTHRHIAEHQPIPQPCCYPVLITVARLEGPPQQHRAWLAPVEVSDD